MLEFSLIAEDNSTPALRRAVALFDDLTELHQLIAANAEVLTRRHLVEKAAPARHTTAQRLGANPTGYLTRRAQAIESQGTRDSATVTLGGAVEIFARVDGPVTIYPQRKYLTIPASAQAYGRRAGELGSLRFIAFGSGAKALAAVKVGTKTGKRGKPVKDVQLTVHYWLRDKVTLSQDRGLLPTEEQYVEAGEAAAQTLLEDILENT
jgi:hypothetical protein